MGYNTIEKGRRLLERESTPRQTLTVGDAIALILGVVIGVGIFKTPSLIAAQTGRVDLFLLAWAAGGVISLAGALCYAELATAYPHAGGDYHYITRAFGRRLGFLFVWSRMTVIQPGSIAMLAFVFGDYFARILPLGGYAPSFYAALTVTLLTAVNLLGTRQGKGTQNLLTACKVIGLFSIIVMALIASPPPGPAVPGGPRPEASFGLAMVFVLLTFGGWNEAVYLSAELSKTRRSMLRALLWGIGIITAIYLLINLSYLKVLGMAGMGASDAVAADFMSRVLGPRGIQFISLLIMISALGAINASILTGSRTNFTLGQDFPLFGFLGKWEARSNAPARALLLQGAVSLILILLGALVRTGFVAMVEYTAPVFWCFFLLGGLSLIVLRGKEPEIPRPFRAPFYPLTPLVFCGTCVYMLQSSLVYTGVGAVVGVAVLGAGALLLLCTQGGVRWGWR